MDIVPLVTPFSLGVSEFGEFLDHARALHHANLYRSQELTGEVANFIRSTCDLKSHEVVTTRSGTDALRLALGLADLSPGDRVAMPSLGFHAVGALVVGAGLSPVWVDVDRSTWNISPIDLANAIEEFSPKAAIAIDNFGSPCDIADISATCVRAGIPLILDACESFGAGRHYSALQNVDFIAYSFSFTKPIHSFGSGGALAISSRREMGESKPGKFLVEQSQMPSINAVYLLGAAGSLQMALAHLRGTYDSLAIPMTALGFIGQEGADGSNRMLAPFMFDGSLRHGARDDLIRLLADLGVEARMQFPPQHTIFRGVERPLPNTDYLAPRLISLPTGAGMRRADLNRVVEILGGAVGEAWLRSATI